MLPPDAVLLMDIKKYIQKKNSSSNVVSKNVPYLVWRNHGDLIIYYLPFYTYIIKQQIQSICLT